MNAPVPASGIRTGFRLTTVTRAIITESLNFGLVLDALDAAVDDPALKNRTLCVWEVPGTGKPGALDATVQDWRLVTLANPCPRRYRTLHDAGCDPQEQGCCSCERRTPVAPGAWCDLFAGLTLSHLFHLAPKTRAELSALRWPFPPDADRWTYPGVADTVPHATLDATHVTAPAH
ncbi:hypothetical protein ABTY61_22785 [Kitasatospora sp. NPDC096128]|uniref:hypothetical protein n=1 Tax=Kitasatospora sp. NPDC096128 TaxID=3155547 RepID=UPI00331CC283